MATTEITQSIKDITGESSLSSHVIEDGQRFVTASLPKHLLENMVARAGSSNDGSAMTAANNDSIVDVQRDGYSCKRVPLSQAKWVADSTSLHYATARHPVYYFQQNSGIMIVPATAGGAVGYYFHVDSSLIDDDSDLRNIVINHACSKEFSRLAKGETLSLTWSNIPVPSAPSSPSFTTPNIVLPNAPIFIPPTMQAPNWSDVENWINTEEDSEMLSSRVQAIQAQIGDFSARLSSSQQEFNEGNVEFQAKVQEQQQEVSLTLQKENQEYAAKIQKYGAEVGEYTAKVNEMIQINQGKVAEWQAESGMKMNHYLQMSAQYYNWCLSEIKTYIENHPTTLDKMMQMRESAK